MLRVIVDRAMSASEVVRHHSERNIRNFYCFETYKNLNRVGATLSWLAMHPVELSANESMLCCGLSEVAR